MTEILHPVKQRHMAQVLTHSRTLPEAPASNLGHPCTHRVLCSCWEELPTPRPRGAQELSLWRGKKKNPPQEPFFTSAELSQTWAWLNSPVPNLAFDLLLLEYLSHRFPICIRDEPIFSLDLIWYFFHIDDLRGANHSDLMLAKSQHWRTAKHKSQHSRNIQ